MNKLKYIAMSILLMVLFLECKGPDKQENSTLAIQNESLTKDSSESRDENEKWLNFYNLKSDSIRFLYSQDATKVFVNGTILENRNDIADFYMSEPLKISKVYTDTLLLANQDRNIEYEIGGFINNDEQNYKHLIIWQTIDSARQRVFEFIIVADIKTQTHSKIDAQRKKWIRLSNDHDAEKIVEELYTENTLYFNHKPVIKGRKALIKEYQYMNGQNYELMLNPITTNFVNEEFVFEIGQCKGSYNGKYILIWRKDADNEWRIFIDSNI